MANNNGRKNGNGRNGNGKNGRNGNNGNNGNNGKNGKNGTTQRRGPEYFSGKTFDQVQREAMKKAGIED